jgi:hypothetical protein
VNNFGRFQKVFPLMLVAVVLTLAPAQSATKMVRYSDTETYEISGALLSGLGAQDSTCDAKGKNCRLARDGYIDAGSVTFRPIGGIGKVNLQVTINDSLNLFGQVFASICQDTNANNTCGDTPGDAVLNACFVPGKPRVLAGVDRELPILAFFFPPVSGCTTDPTDVANHQSMATSGTITLSGLIPASSPRKLQSITHTFTSTVPCANLSGLAGACSYLVLDPLDLTTSDYKLGCTAPGPAGSYSDLVVTAPKGANQIYITETPRTSWDLFLCAKPARGNNGAYINKSWTDPHCQALGLVGCKNTLSAPVVPGRKYVVRNFNSYDAPGATITGTIQFRKA